MAIIVPIVLAAAGASAAVTIGVSLALAVTGISAKIDKAASKVFGKDLVTVASIAGAVYLAYSGGAFGGGGESSASAVSNVSALDPSEFGALAGAENAAGSVTGAASGATQQGGALANAAGDTSFDAWDFNPAGGGGGGISADQARYGMLENSAAASGGNPAAGASTATPPGAPPKPFADAVWDKVTGAWKSLGDRGQGALLQVGGNLLSGMANGAAQAKAAADQRAYDSKYRSGSGLTQWAPRRTVYSPGG